MKYVKSSLGREVDKHHALFLFQTYAFSEGVDYYCKINKQWQLLVNYYIKHKETKNAIITCIDFYNCKGGTQSELH